MCALLLTEGDLFQVQTCRTPHSVIPVWRFRIRSTPRSSWEFFGPSGRSKASTMRSLWWMERSSQCRKTSWLQPALTSGQTFLHTAGRTFVVFVAAAWWVCSLSLAGSDSRQLLFHVVAYSAVNNFVSGPNWTTILLKKMGQPTELNCRESPWPSWNRSWTTSSVGRWFPAFYLKMHCVLSLIWSIYTWLC